MDFVIKGIWENGAPWDNNGLYISEQYARELLDFDPEYFDIAGIHLNNPDESIVFAEKLDKYLTDESSVLRSEHAAQASAFYSNQAGIQKNFFTFFVIFLLFVIALGIRATVRMNLFERMKEFGTIRAIGFNRFQCLLIIFLEIFFLSLIALGLALLSSIIVILVFNQTGIYIGNGPMSYSIGGDRFYLVIKFGDIIFAVMAMIVLSLLAPFKPGLKLCYQNISDILIKKQKRTFLSVLLIKRIFKKRIKK
jgi:ABC-type lipoprotein release transport system permease subunit